MAEIRGLSGRKPVQQQEQPGVWESMFANLISGVVSGGAKTAMDTYAQTEYIMPAEARIKDQASYNKMAQEGFMQTGQPWPSYEEYLAKGLPEGWGDTEGFTSGGVIGLKGQAQAEAQVVAHEAKAASDLRSQHEQNAALAETKYAGIVEGFQSDLKIRQKAVAESQVTSGSTSKQVTTRLQSQTDYFNKLQEGRKAFIEWAHTPENKVALQELRDQSPQFAKMYHDTLNDVSLNESSRLLGNTKTDASRWQNRKVTPKQVEALKEIERRLNRESWNVTFLRLQVTARQIESHYIAAGHVKVGPDGKPDLLNGRPQLTAEKQGHMDNIHGIIVFQAFNQRVSEYITGGGDASPSGLKKLYQSFSPGVHSVIGGLRKRNPTLPHFSPDASPHIQHYLKSLDTPDTTQDSDQSSLDDPAESLVKLVDASRPGTSLGDNWVRHDKLTPEQTARIDSNMPIESRYLLASLGIGGGPTGRISAKIGQRVGTNASGALRGLRDPSSERRKALDTAGSAVAGRVLPPVQAHQKSDRERVAAATNFWNTGAEAKARYSEEKARVIFEGQKGAPEFDASASLITDSIGADTPKIISSHVSGLRHWVEKFNAARREIIQDAIKVNASAVKFVANTLGITDAQLTFIGSREAIANQTPLGGDVDASRATAQRVFNKIVGDDLDQEIQNRLDRGNLKEQVLDNIEKMFSGTPTGRSLSRLLVPDTLRIKGHKPKTTGTVPFADPSDRTKGPTDEDQGLISLEGVDSYARKEVIKHLMYLHSSGMTGPSSVAAREIITGLQSGNIEERIKWKNRVSEMTRFVGLTSVDAIGLNKQTGELEIDLEVYRAKIHRLMGSPDGPIRMLFDGPVWK